MRPWRSQKRMRVIALTITRRRSQPAQRVVPSVGLVAVHVREKFAVVRRLQSLLHFLSQRPRRVDGPLRQQAGVHHRVVALGVHHRAAPQPGDQLGGIGRLEDIAETCRPCAGARCLRTAPGDAGRGCRAPSLRVRRGRARSAAPRETSVRGSPGRRGTTTDPGLPKLALRSSCCSSSKQPCTSPIAYVAMRGDYSSGGYDLWTGALAGTKNVVLRIETISSITSRM